MLFNYVDLNMFMRIDDLVQVLSSIPFRVVLTTFGVVLMVYHSKSWCQIAGLLSEK